MNPILHELQNKQWVWTAANAKQQTANTTLSSGYKAFDSVLAKGFPAAGMIHLQSPLGCGEMRLMLSIIEHQQSQHDEHKLYMFINPPFALNAEFLLAHNISLSQLIVVNTRSTEEALWSAEQCAKSGACCAVFLWQKSLNYLQIRKLENAAQKGACHCVWLDEKNHLSAVGTNKQGDTNISNLPLSLSLTISRDNNHLNITINKQKIGWAQKAVSISLPFKARTHYSNPNTHKPSNSHNIVPLQINR